MKVKLFKFPRCDRQLAVTREFNGFRVWDFLRNRPITKSHVNQKDATGAVKKMFDLLKPSKFEAWLDQGGMTA